MTDDPRPKRAASHPAARRLQTSGDRDLASEAARREREAVPYVVETSDEISGHYDVEERAQMRARRPTAQRLAILEVKHDELALTVAGMDGKVTAILEYSAKADAAREKQEQAKAVDRASARAQIVPVIKALGIALALVAAAIVGHHGV